MVTTIGTIGRYDNDQGGELGGFEGARAPPEPANAPPHCQEHPVTMKENLMKHHLKQTSNQQIYCGFEL